MAELSMFGFVGALAGSLAVSIFVLFLIFAVNYLYTRNVEAAPYEKLGPDGSLHSGLDFVKVDERNANAERLSNDLYSFGVQHI
ncbi:hypothetical protein AAVH_15242 [Aphelenchoides avenae]|nr:hypothetical protein AAVH_15242 [Aphelenchus avenae]